MDKIDGDYVELGVYQGNSARKAVRIMLGMASARKMWLYDSFQGLPDTIDQDGADAKIYVGELSDTSPDLVRSSLVELGFPQELIQIRPGYFNETVPLGIEQGDIAQKVALLHLDSDWYDSTMQGLEYFYDRVVPGGIVVIDDFGYWEGSRVAFYDFFARRREYPLLERAGVHAAWFIKGKEHNRWARSPRWPDHNDEAGDRKSVV